jgi:hypothetical protein
MTLSRKVDCTLGLIHTPKNKHVPRAVLPIPGAMQIFHSSRNANSRVLGLKRLENLSQGPSISLSPSHRHFVVEMSSG